MKTADLTGADLDYWVAKAEGWELNGVMWREWVKQGDRGHYGEQPHKDDWRPSTDWAQGGPIIQRRRINIMTNDERPELQVLARIPGGGEHAVQFGPTPLIAAMRAYVASVFGEDVDATA